MADKEIMQTFASRNRVIWLHISFWCVYLSFNLYQLSFYQRRIEVFDWSKGIAMTLLQLLSTMLIAYLNYFYFLPRFLHSKKIGRYLLEFLIPFIIILIVRTLLQRYIIDGYTHKEHFFYSTMFIVQTVAITLFIVIFISMLKFLGDWFEFEARKKEVENERLITELNFLKAQINPHFLFNTLNNLYYLAYSKSDNTTEVIAKLSQMMRYMIYDSNHDKVLLSKEIEYMQNYISLERLRLNNQIPIKFETSGNVDGVLIAPLILITFLENAFKHGVTNNNKDAWVDISIDVKDKICMYEVKNSKIQRAAQDNGGKSGIGLKNVMRRLELSYPGQYEINVEDEPDRYAVKLKLLLI
jgi:two-component system, LytTR family, sensor histidine kinase AlgZ